MRTKGDEWTLVRHEDGSAVLDLWVSAPIPGTSSAWSASASVRLAPGPFTDALLTATLERREHAVQRALERARAKLDVGLQPSPVLARAAALLRSLPESDPGLCGFVLGFCAALAFALLVGAHR